MLFTIIHMIGIYLLQFKYREKSKGKNHRLNGLLWYWTFMTKIVSILPIKRYCIVNNTFTYSSI